MIRPSICFASALMLVAFSLPVHQAIAQQDLPSAPSASDAVRAATPPAAPVPAAVQYPMPKPVPANFTAASPTKEAVNAFIQTVLGSDGSKVWEVWAIQKTPAEGVSLVTIFVNDKGETHKPTGVEFYAMPDGTHFLTLDQKGMIILPAAAQPEAAPVAAAPDTTQATASTAAPAPAAHPFPLQEPSPANFTAPLPTKETVNAFLKVSWGYDENRIWKVWAIQKTPAEGVSKVTLLVSDKSETQKPVEVAFFAMPDGKHFITLGQDGMDVFPFGENPFKEYREIAKQRADGPYRGSAMKDLEIVEFADFQCPHCKEAQANMEKLAVDFPKARIVFQNFPLGNAQWKGSMPAATYGVCVAKQGGSGAFFTYASAVFDGQAGLVSEDSVALTLNSAVVKAGLDPTKIAECASTPTAIATVEASRKLATDLNVHGTPKLIINGRQISATMPYDTIKQVILYQAKVDGVAAQ